VYFRSAILDLYRCRLSELDQLLASIGGGGRAYILRNEDFPGKQRASISSRLIVSTSISTIFANKVAVAGAQTSQSAQEAQLPISLAALHGYDTPYEKYLIADIAMLVVLVEHTLHRGKRFMTTHQFKYSLILRRNLR
jgi:hypothetical protein